MSPFTGLNIKFMWRILRPDETVLTITKNCKRLVKLDVEERLVKPFRVKLEWFPGLMSFQSAFEVIIKVFLAMLFILGLRYFVV